ncbi:MAG: glycoside hydrolase family 3 N-terminal domain-containing protein [Paludibacter sp.]|nr:glycoside hydrolase family 3 N-terminal domain-containing protein [Paludibacter sp.]
MRKLLLCFVVLSSTLNLSAVQMPEAGKPVKEWKLGKSPMYKKGWIDFNKNGKMDIYENPSAQLDARIEDLLSQMTLEEKTCQLATLYGYKRVLQDDLPTPKWKEMIWKDGIGAIDEHLNGFQQWGLPPSDNPNCWPASRHAWAINEVQRFFIEETRLGIPADMTNEGIRGVEAFRATNFPTQLGLGHTWNRDLIKKVGYITGREARLLGYTNVYAPILDVGRDQRWGRYEEVYGECPYLVSELGVAMTKGLQTNYQVAATAKHFVAYSNNKGAREGMARVDPQTTPREVENVHVRPFEEVIRRAGLLGIMCAYNDYDGVPIQGSFYWLTQRLRREMGFRGYVVSDSGSVEYLYNKHNTADDMKEAVRQSFEAGLNVRCTFSAPDTYILPLRELVQEKAVSEETLNDRVRDVLRVKFTVGLFDSPYQMDLKAADNEVDGEENNKVSLQAARESIVLLKNENNLLPLDASKIKRIAVVGPNADERSFALLHYGPLAAKVTSVLEGLSQNLNGKCEVVYEKGCNLVDDRWPLSEILREELTVDERAGINKAVKVVEESDVAVIVLGGGERTCGENKSRSSLELPGRQEDLLRAVHATGKPVILVMINGRPNSINWADAHVPAIVEAWYPGAHGGQAVYEVLFGEYNPGGKLTVTFPRHVGQIPFNFPSKPAANVDGNIKPGVKGNQSRVNGALYHFGYGLSYTTFAYSNLTLTPAVATDKEPVSVSFDVTNTGSRAGDEIAQLYVRDKVSSVTTYEKNLCGFERVHLLPGETKRISMIISPKQLALLDLDMRWVVEPGDFDVMVGASSEDIRLRNKLTIVSGKAAKKAESFLDVLPWKFKANEYFTFPLVENARIDYIDVQWSKNTYCDFEIQLTSGGGQFLTVYKGKVEIDENISRYSFPLTNASEMRILIVKGKGGVDGLESPLIKR